MGSPGQIIAQAAVSGYDEAHARKQQRKDQLSDEDRQSQAQDLIQTRLDTKANLPSIKGRFGEGSPQWNDAIQTIAQSKYDLHQLYDPIKNPGALEADWHFLLYKLHGVKMPNGMKKPSASTSKKPAGTQDSPTAPPQGTPTAQGSTPAVQGSTPAASPSQATTTTPVAPPTSFQATPAAAPLTWKTRRSWQSPKELKQKLEAMQKAHSQAVLEASSIGLTPQEQAMSDFQVSAGVNEAKINEALRLAKKLGIEGPALEEFEQQLIGMKNVVFKPLSGVAGTPTKGEDGRYYQAGSDANGNVVTRPMPPDWKPNTKAVRGTLINTKSNGWIQTWVDPYNPSRVIGYQKVTPGSRYTGTTSTSSSTDPFGLTTSTSRSSTPTSGSTPVDVDLSGMQQLPQNYDGEDLPTSPAAAGQSSPSTTPPSGSPNKSAAPSVAPPANVKTPKVGATQASLRSQVPAPPQAAAPSAHLTLDATGHIPTSAPYNANLIGAANNILDGMDVEKLPIPQKAREAAQNLARAYGWGGQGMFTPREALQLKEGATFLNMMAKSPALKVLDNGFFANVPMTGASPDPQKEGFFGRLASNLSSRAQSPEQQQFMDLYRQLDAMAIGLRALVQTGRGTQKQTDLLISELPNPFNTPSAEDARRRLRLVQKELDIAAKTGKLPEAEQIQDDFNSSKNGTGSLSLDDFKKKHNLPQ